ncbi:hypothetical protein ACFLTP_04790 [Chloroflexota bacterium]
MKKMSEFFYLKPLRIITSLIVIGLFITILVYIAKTYNISLAISLLALTVASVAAIANLISLKWTRDTIRPFLSLNSDGIKMEQIKTHISIPFRIFNSGSLPSTDVDVDIDFFAQNEVITEDNHSSRFARAEKSLIPNMIHPNNYYTEKYILNLKDKGDLELWESINQGKVAFRLRVYYTSRGRKHVTISTNKMHQPSWEKGLILESILPQKWI